MLPQQPTQPLSPPRLFPPVALQQAQMALQQPQGPLVVQQPHGVPQNQLRHHFTAATSAVHNTDTAATSMGYGTPQQPLPQQLPRSQQPGHLLLKVKAKPRPPSYQKRTEDTPHRVTITLQLYHER